MNVKVETKVKQPIDAAKAAPVADQPKVDETTGETSAPSEPKANAKKQREYRAADGAEYLPKVSAKSVMGDEFMKSKPLVQEDLFRVIGLVRRAEVSSSQYGDSFRFKGSFKVVRVHDGARYHSTQFFAPRALEGLIAEQIESAQENDDGDVQFVVIIGRKPSAKGGAGYEYTFKPVLEVVQHDPLQALEDAANAAMPLLAAPKSK